MIKKSFKEKKESLIKYNTISSNFEESLRIINKFRLDIPKIISIDSLDNLLSQLHLLNIDDTNIKGGITNVFKYAQSNNTNIYENFLLIYDFLIDTVILDNGNLFKANKIFNMSKKEKSTKITKYDIFILLSYLFLNLTTTFHLFYDPNTTYDTNYNRFFCILNYFIQIKNLLNDEKGLEYLKNTYLFIIRVECKDYLKDDDFLNLFWGQDTLPISNAELLLKESIYDLGYKGIECDFANEFLGGGVLLTGRVQEEIKFTINTELLASMFFNPEPMDVNEAIIITGSECFSNFSGYANSFKYEGNAFDLNKSINNLVVIDNISYANNSILLAIDATYLKSYMDNFNLAYAIRDLRKSYVGFSFLDAKKYENIPSLFFESYNSKSVVTGKWGCGCFNGDPELKFIIQLLTCSINKRELVYTFYNDVINYERTKFIMGILKSNKVTISRLFKILIDCFENSDGKKFSFYDEIIKILFKR